MRVLVTNDDGIESPGLHALAGALHAGTVGAALTAANLGVCGMAVSTRMDDPICWGTAGELAVAAMRWLVDAPLCTVLNLNVPNVPIAMLRGVRWAEPAPYGTVRA